MHHLAVVVQHLHHGHHLPVRLPQPFLREPRVAQLRRRQAVMADERHGEHVPLDVQRPVQQRVRSRRRDGHADPHHTVILTPRCQRIATARTRPSWSYRPVRGPLGGETSRGQGMRAE